MLVPQKYRTLVITILAAAVALVVGQALSLIPTTINACFEYPANSGEEQCASYYVVYLPLVYAAHFLNNEYGVVAALATVALVYIAVLQTIALRRTYKLQRAWVFAGCGETELRRNCDGTPVLDQGRRMVRAHPDHRNYGGAPAFVDYLEFDYWDTRADGPLPEKFPALPPERRLVVMDPLPVEEKPRRFNEPIATAWKAIRGDTYIFGRIYYRDVFDMNQVRWSTFAYRINFSDGEHIRPYRAKTYPCGADEVPPVYWECT